MGVYDQTLSTSLLVQRSIFDCICEELMNPRRISAFIHK